MAEEIEEGTDAPKGKRFVPKKKPAPPAVKKAAPKPPRDAEDDDTEGRSGESFGAWLNRVTDMEF